MPYICCVEKGIEFHIEFYCNLFINSIMNKSELVSAIAAESGLTKADSKKALDAAVAAVSKALKGGDKVTLVGFGTFSVAKRAARQGINPATKKAIKIPAKSVVKFKAGSELEL